MLKLVCFSRCSDASVLVLDLVVLSWLVGVVCMGHELVCWRVGAGVLELVCWSQCCGSKYIEFGSGSGPRILAQFRSGSGSRVILSILKEKVQNNFREI